jgi:hypothetical protein
VNPLERTILRQLFGDNAFTERVATYLRERYFQSEESATIFRMFDAFYQKFHTSPSFAALRIGIDGATTLTEATAKSTQAALTDVENEPLLDSTQKAWMLEATENWCQERAMYCALQDAIKVMDDPKATKHVIPDLMRDALTVSFDTHVGHDYFADAADRYKFYHDPATKIPFDIDTFNKLTAGGVPRKTLNLILAGTNVGKSLILCHLASHYVRSSLNVLYISCEMAQEWCAHRIDANLMDIPMDDVVDLPEADYNRKIAHLRSTSTGRLIIKGYEAGVFHAGVLRTLLQELSLKERFVPDVILVDYLTICASSRVKLSATTQSYSYHKMIAEELRGVAQEHNVPMWSAAQFNRQGFAASDPGLEHIGESFAIAHTADFAIAAVQTEELEKLGQVSIIELKNRYNRRRSWQQHILGMDTSRMKIYELSAAQLSASLTVPSAPATGQQGMSGGLSAFQGSRRRSKPLGTLRKENENNTAT